MRDLLTGQSPKTDPAGTPIDQQPPTPEPDAGASMLDVQATDKELAERISMLCDELSAAFADADSAGLHVVTPPEFGRPYGGDEGLVRLLNVCKIARPL